MRDHQYSTRQVYDRMLLFGDNLDLLRRFPAESVDLVYADPPFNSNKNYNAIFKAQSGQAPSSQLKAFEDTWQWDQETVHLFQKATTVLLPSDAATALIGFQKLLGNTPTGGSPLLAYLTNMAVRLDVLKRVLKPSATVYVHCDPGAGHYLKILLDAIFGPKNFLNEIVWHYRTSSGAPRYWLHRNHDTILRYAAYDPTLITWNHPREPWPKDTLKKWQTDEQGNIYRQQHKYGKRYYINPEGKLQDDVWELTFSSRTHERLGYETQKPEALLEKIIRASSNEGDVVMDPFLGGGTTAVAAERLGRRWIGIDVTGIAVNMTRRRLKKNFPYLTDEDLYIDGWPRDIEDARSLAEYDTHQFQVWACDMIDAAPNESKGADAGIDGRIVFYEDQQSTDPKFIIVSVKSGKVDVDDIRVLNRVVERESAEIGVFITLRPPTRDMRIEAANAGVYQTFFGEHPRLQILTVDDLLEGERPSYPEALNMTYQQITNKKDVAALQKRKEEEQGEQLTFGE